MKSRKLPIALLSFTLAWGGLCVPAGAAPRPGGARASRGVVLLWLERIWNDWIPAWTKSRGTMDPDGLPTATPVAPGTPTPTATGTSLPTPDRVTPWRGPLDLHGLTRRP